jgi:hypothetical protein
MLPPPPSAAPLREAMKPRGFRGRVRLARWNMVSCGICWWVQKLTSVHPDKTCHQIEIRQNNVVCLQNWSLACYSSHFTSLQHGYFITFCVQVPTILEDCFEWLQILQGGLVFLQKWYHKESAENLWLTSGFVRGATTNFINKTRCHKHRFVLTTFYNFANRITGIEIATVTWVLCLEHTAELGYNVTKGTKYCVSL